MIRKSISLPLILACAFAVAACGQERSSELARFDRTPKSCSALTKSTASVISDFAGSMYTSVGLSKVNLDELPPTPGARDYGCDARFLAAGYPSGPPGKPATRSINVSFKLYDSGDQVAGAKNSFQISRDAATGKPKVSAAIPVTGIGDEAYAVDDASLSSAYTTVTFRSSNMVVTVGARGSDFGDSRLADGAPSSELIAGVHSASEAVAHAVGTNLESIVNDNG
ncbi:hypothetical protein [Nocardia salmonicida]|uniref:hypothetical protein n=1 Tax=Nocardia salmonicida TaxID=53431 RepID=UPI003403D732